MLPFTVVLVLVLVSQQPSGTTTIPFAIGVEAAVPPWLLLLVMIPFLLASMVADIGVGGGVVVVVMDW
uniref:Putative secreted peptide n=1 Tax=Anopheles braziliensis TaxID=58242 RepID=A0A2M3ZS66_9DIPT